MRSLLRRESLRLAEATLEQTLETLVAFLRAERYAVVTYDAALVRIADPDIRDELGRLRLSHAARALILGERVREFGGPGSDRAAEGVEPWGAFASACPRVQGARDEAGVVRALGEGENWALRDYELDLQDVEVHLRRQLVRLLLGEQRRTRGRLLRLSSRAGRSLPSAAE